MSAEALIQRAFDRLSQKPGFVERGDQRQLAMLLSDCIASKSTGAFEAPTGLGKSLASLIPAIAHALANGKRTVIATYTNVLAEQYWRTDLPLARSLFDAIAKSEFLIGRQRYACLASVHENVPAILKDLRPVAKLGIESEFRQAVRRPVRELTPLWQQISAPPVCPGRLCPHYNDCYYYRARRSAEKAQIVITNHSVVLQDALLHRASEGELSMLGEYDFLIIDEAHDFAQAAQSGLEFELSEAKLNLLAGLAGRIENALLSVAIEAAEPQTWMQLCTEFKKKVESAAKSVKGFGLGYGGPGILAVKPDSLEQHPQVKSRWSQQGLYSAKELAGNIAREAVSFVSAVDQLIARWRLSGAINGQQADDASDTIHNYTMYIREFASGCEALFTPSGVAVSYAGGQQGASFLRHDVLGLADPLKELLWDRVPWACLSATLAVDGTFDYFKRSTGAEPQFEEVLPSPFDFASQASVYVPKIGRIPDPTVARKVGTEEHYFKAVADELKSLIEAVGGRTLALFHSRREMEAVRELIDLPPDLPILMQRFSGAASTGERFIQEKRASLFALRSFWTGFDAPGETLSCVALVRVPFEVPIDPPQVARLAWLQTLGMDAFQSHTLPVAKMLMRQGAGRLIRRASDRGIIALLDPRLRTKRYGEEILANLPPGMRTFDDIHEAVACVGLEPALPIG